MIAANVTSGCRETPPRSGLIARDPPGQHYFTKEGRAVFKALVADELE
jgi:hypothetical protein